MKNRIFLAQLFTLMTFTSLSHAGVSLLLEGGATFSNPKSEGTSAFTSTQDTGIVGGLGLGFGLGKVVDLELGGYYTQNKFKIPNTSSGEVKDEFDQLVMPLLLRFRLSRFFTIGVGGYGSYKMGKVKTTTQGVTVESEYSALGYEDTDYGALGSATIELPLGKSVSFVLDGRYSYGLRDLDKSAGTKVFFRSFQAMGGFRFQLSGSKN